MEKEGSISWYCKKCGLIYYLEPIENGITTRMWCPCDFSEMRRVKENMTKDTKLKLRKKRK